MPKQNGQPKREDYLANLKMEKPQYFFENP